MCLFCRCFPIFINSRSSIVVLMNRITDTNTFLSQRACICARVQGWASMCPVLPCACVCVCVCFHVRDWVDRRRFVASSSVKYIASFIVYISGYSLVAIAQEFLLIGYNQYGQNIH